MTPCKSYSTGSSAVIIFKDGSRLPREVPYSIILKSKLKVVAQLSRLDTTSNNNAFMTSLGWGSDI